METCFANEVASLTRPSKTLTGVNCNDYILLTYFNTYFCGVVQSKYSSKKQYRSAKRVSNTEHRLVIALVARVRGRTCHIY